MTRKLTMATPDTIIWYEDRSAWIPIEPDMKTGTTRKELD